MKKTLIALAVLGVTSAAFAQSNVTIYGQVDIGYKKVTATSLTMAERDPNSRIGFMGTEDLGGGLKATDQLEQRFALMNGVSSARGDFEGASNVGLAGSFGQVRFGRVNELSTETYRRLDPFNQVGVAQAIYTPLRGTWLDGRLSYTARYDAPAFNGINLGATYTVANQPTVAAGSGGYGGFGETTLGNNGYALSATYTGGPLYLVANYNKAVNSLGSYNWNLGAAYAFGPLKVSAGYEETQNKMVGAQQKEKNYLIGLAYTVGAGVINASWNSSDWSGAGGSADKYAIGYTHNLSKRTSLYANYAHLAYTGSYYLASSTAAISTKTSSANNSAVEVGITHKF